MSPSLFSWRQHLPGRSVALALGGAGVPRAPGRRALLVGPVDGPLRSQLLAGELALEEVESVPRALQALAAGRFDAVIQAAAAPFGLDLVRRLKVEPTRGETGAEVVELARARNPLVPVFLTPMPGDSEYAVIVKPPGVCFLEDALTLPLHLAVLRLELRALLDAGEPLA